MESKDNNEKIRIKNDLTKENDFNIYYLNFPKVYEMAMIIDNKMLTSYQIENSNIKEITHSRRKGLDVSGGGGLLSSIKSSISSDISDRHTTNSKVVESIEVQTTKSTLLRQILSYCKVVKCIADNVNEGDLLKIESVQLKILDEDSLRQFLVLKRDALKGLIVEGMEINNLVTSMLQDYSYVLTGQMNGNEVGKNILIKIPMEAQAEFENKYKVDDILIGKVSIIGIYKGQVDEKDITANTFTFFKDRGEENRTEGKKRIFRSVEEDIFTSSVKNGSEEYAYIDVLAIIQDVRYREIASSSKIHWWNRLGLWLARVGRKDV